jgi:transitional endoplasmic reticulum ATPase
MPGGPWACPSRSSGVTRQSPTTSAYVNLRGSHNAETLLPALGRTQRAALCFYGVPGTGKTEFGHHIAKCLGRELMVRSGSDLLSPWVGQTEQLIAQMFEEAADRADEVVLLLDEADTLLGDRSHARASWEISHTNEFLAQMESFPGLFICTTNLVDRLDAAVLRRFQFRLEFEALRADQLPVLCSCRPLAVKPRRVRRWRCSAGWLRCAG